MCGFAGFITLQNKTLNRDLSKTIKRMSDSLEHRGPDSDGCWIDKDRAIALGHRRLAILDLSPAGHQPMVSANQRYIIVFNGEIYNFKEIRVELEKLTQCVWRGESDTEVLLLAIEYWGIHKALQKTRGMFALAIWDREDEKIILARDRMGEKPLYYGWTKSAFLFSSELKAMCKHPSWYGEIDRKALGLMLKYSYIPSPYTIYKGIFKLEPGAILELPYAKLHEKSIDAGRLSHYWSVSESVTSAINKPFEGDDKDAVEKLHTLLSSAVKEQMISDVPLGAFLSGGIDSSTIVALMQAQSTNPVKTFSIGFNEKDYNEAQYAKLIAKHLGTEHTELYVTPKETQDVIPLLPSLYDEPFADSSQIPTYLVSKLAKEKVTVSLSGDGGDELFAGYSRYSDSYNLWKQLNYLPHHVRFAIGKAIQKTPQHLLGLLFLWMKPILLKKGYTGSVSDKLLKISNLLASNNSYHQLYMNFIAHWKNPEELVLGMPLLESHDEYFNGVDSEQLDYMGMMMMADTLRYLPDDILTKVDRAAMGVSLESRVPMLDHRVVEFSWQLPLSMKIKDNKSKWVLREVLDKYVPKHLIERPKKGFGVPIDNWLRGSLKGWAEELLDENRIKQEGFFNTELVREKWNEHQSGKRNWHYYLWDVIMFQAWMEENN